MSVERENHKTGEALKAQRFQMLEDIAGELSKELIFPTCFDITIQLRELLDDPDASLEQISGVISLDPMISSRLVCVANSVLNRRGAPPVKDVHAAVMRIGTKSVRTLALGVAMRQLLLAKDLSDFDGMATRLWEHSVTSGAACAVLARKFGRVTPEEAMFAGLVHDLGASYMFYRASQYEELRSRPDTVKHLVYQWHESIGESLLFALGLPEEIALATRDHDHPRPIPEHPRNLADIVYIGNIMAGGHFEWMKKDFDAAERARAQLPESYASLIDEMRTTAQELTSALDI